MQNTSGDNSLRFGVLILEDRGSIESGHLLDDNRQFDEGRVDLADDVGANLHAGAVRDRWRDAGSTAGGGRKDKEEQGDDETCFNYSDSDLSALW